MRDGPNWAVVAAAAAGVAALVALPAYASGYFVSLSIVVFANVALATAWAFFSGATRYISLATAAFIGVGTYSLAILHNAVPVAVALAAAPVVGFAIALVVGLATLRLRGVYFVIFTFGLTELTKQLFIWYEINRNRTMSRYIFADVTNASILQILVAVAAVTIAGSWYASRTRLGFALRAIGEDETVARHTGINTTRVKVMVFALSAAVMALVGAALSLRYPYIDPNIAFNSTWSFQVLIAALLGGPARPWGPALGAVPLVLLSEYLAGSFPHHFGIALGLCFVIIVFFLPRGVAGPVEQLARSLAAPRARASAH